MTEDGSRSGREIPTARSQKIRRIMPKCSSTNSQEIPARAWPCEAGTADHLRRLVRRHLQKGYETVSHFKEMHFGNTTHDLSHLDPLKLGIQFEDNAYTAPVRFSCHCFTETFDASRHDGRAAYEHGNETRAFDTVRYQLSLSLPDLFRTLGNKIVYHTKRGSFFFIRRLPDETANVVLPHVVFRTYTADMDGADVIVEVASACPKPGMAHWAAPVRFPRLIGSTVRGYQLPLGQRFKVKMRQERKQAPKSLNRTSPFQVPLGTAEAAWPPYCPAMPNSLIHR